MFNNDFLKRYYKCLIKNNYVIKEHSTYDEISTPFLDNINDNISIYVDHLPENNILLSDYSYTLNNLETMGITLTPARKTIIENICKQFKIKLMNSDVLTIKGTEQDFPIMKHNLLSAILKINDLMND